MSNHWNYRMRSIDPIGCKDCKKKECTLGGVPAKQCEAQRRREERIVAFEQRSVDSTQKQERQRARRRGDAREAVRGGGVGGAKARMEPGSGAGADRDGSAGADLDLASNMRRLRVDTLEDCTFAVLLHIPDNYGRYGPNAVEIRQSYVLNYTLRNLRAIVYSKWKELLPNHTVKENLKFWFSNSTPMVDEGRTLRDYNVVCDDGVIHAGLAYPDKVRANLHYYE